MEDGDFDKENPIEVFDSNNEDKERLLIYNQEINNIKKQETLSNFTFRGGMIFEIKHNKSVQTFLIENNKWTYEWGFRACLWKDLPYILSNLLDSSTDIKDSKELVFDLADGKFDAIYNKSDANKWKHQDGFYEKMSELKEIIKPLSANISKEDSEKIKRIGRWVLNKIKSIDKEYEKYDKEHQQTLRQNISLDNISALSKKKKAGCISMIFGVGHFGIDEKIEKTFQEMCKEKGVSYIILSPNEIQKSKWKIPRN